MKKRIVILSLINLILLIIGKFNIDAIMGLGFIDFWIILNLFIEDRLS